MPISSTVHRFLLITNLHGVASENRGFTKFYFDINRIRALIRIEITEGTSGVAELFGDEQILRERPQLIDPLRFTAEAGRDRHIANFLQRIFMTAFSPDGFALNKVH